MPIVFALITALCSQETTVEVRLREWYARYDGAVTANGPLDNGTRFDAESDLGLDSHDLVHQIQLSVDFPEVGRFSLGYWQLRQEGNDVLQADAIFDGQTFPGGSAVEFHLRFDVTSFDYEYPLLQGPVEIGLLAGLRYISGETELKGGGADQHANLNRPLLLPGFRIGAELLPWLRADGRLQGLAFTAHNVKARYLESEVEISARPWPFLSISLGYQEVLTYFKALEDSLNFDLDGSIGGFYVALAVRF